MEVQLTFKKERTDVTDEGAKHKIVLEGVLGPSDEPMGKVKLEISDISSSHMNRVTEDLDVDSIDSAIKRGLGLAIVTTQNQSRLEDHE